MEKKFDIVILDPPYDQIKTRQLETLTNRHVKKSGLAVLSFPGHTAVPVFERADLISRKSYGDAQLAFYRKK